LSFPPPFLFFPRASMMAGGQARALDKFGIRAASPFFTLGPFFSFPFFFPCLERKRAELVSTHCCRGWSRGGSKLSPPLSPPPPPFFFFSAPRIAGMAAARRRVRSRGRLVLRGWENRAATLFPDSSPSPAFLFFSRRRWVRKASDNMHGHCRNESRFIFAGIGLVAF